MRAILPRVVVGHISLPHKLIESYKETNKKNNSGLKLTKEHLVPSTSPKASPIYRLIRVSGVGLSGPTNATGPFFRGRSPS